jgi:hypothetical protein
LNFKYDDIQKRLIDNKILLTKLETPGLKQLNVFIDNLKKRVDKDKEVLLSVNQIKKMDRDVDLKEWYWEIAFKVSHRVLKHKQFFPQACSKDHHGLFSRLQIGAVADGPRSKQRQQRRLRKWKRWLSLRTRIGWEEVKVKRVNGSSRVINFKLFLFPSLFSLFRLLLEEYHSLYKYSRLETLKALNESHHFEIAESIKLKILFSVVVVSANDFHLVARFGSVGDW